MFKALIAFGSLVFFWYLLRAASNRSGRDRTAADTDTERSLRTGLGTGLLGGDIEDAAIAEYALRRTPKDPNSSEERDLGTVLGMQRETKVQDHGDT